VRALAALPDLRIHDLRHAFASVAVAGGDSLFIVGKLLGHRQASTTERYAHLAPDPAKAVADRTAERLAHLLGSGNAVNGSTMIHHPAPQQVGGEEMGNRAAEPTAEHSGTAGVINVCSVDGSD
jgi:hypothetical protein